MDLRFDELKASGNLPSPSAVALEILRLTQSPDYRLEDLLRPIQVDPILCGRLLKIANSALHADLAPILSIKDALMRVGTKALTHLALSLSVLDRSRHGACQAFDYDAFWSTSLLRALAMQKLTLNDFPLQPAEAFSIGLMAEIGRLALAQIYPEEYASCLDNHYGNLLQQEETAFLINHQQVTLAMLREWGMPEWILSALHQTHCKNFSASDPKIATLANQLALSAIISGELGTDAGVGHLPVLLRNLQLDFQALNQIRGALYFEWRSWGKLLCIPIQDAQMGRSEQIPADSSQEAEQKLKILLVDDDRTELHILFSYLSQQRYDVIIAKDGAQALEQLLLYQPNIVIADYMMANMDGLTLTKALRASEQTQAVYIILITSDTDNSTMSAAFDAGVNDFIVKPIKHDELKARIIGAKRFLIQQQQKTDERNYIRRQAFHFAAEKRKTELISNTDPLTGLPNRRYALERLDEEWANFMLADKPFSILSLDLDLFKAVNDNFGHEVGDKVLMHFAQLLRQTIRSVDTACRMGGEEFIVVAPNSELDTIRNLCERIRDTVEKQQPTTLKLSRLITVSIGGAVANRMTDTSWSDTLKRSDDALYAAKASGRNCTMINESCEKNP